MAPEGVRVVSRAAHRQRRHARRPGPRARRGRAGLRRPPRPTSARRPQLIGRIPGLRCVDCGRLETVADDRVADRAADLASTSATRRTPASGSPACRRRPRSDRTSAGARSSSSPAAPAARSSPAGMLDVGRRRPRGRRQHRRRHRDLRRARLARPGPRHASGSPTASTSAAGACAGDTFARRWTACASSARDVWFNLGDRDLAVVPRARAAARRRRAPDRGARRADRGARGRARACCR